MSPGKGGKEEGRGRSKEERSEEGGKGNGLGRGRKRNGGRSRERDSALEIRFFFNDKSPSSLYPFLQCRLTHPFD